MKGNNVTTAVVSTICNLLKHRHILFKHSVGLYHSLYLLQIKKQWYIQPLKTAAATAMVWINKETFFEQRWLPFRGGFIQLLHKQIVGTHTKPRHMLRCRQSRARQRNLRNRAEWSRNCVLLPATCSVRDVVSCAQFLEVPPPEGSLTFSKGSPFIHYYLLKYFLELRTSWSIH